MTLKKGGAEVREVRDVTPISVTLCDKFSWHAYRTSTRKVNRSRGSFNQVVSHCRLDSNWKPWTLRQTDVRLLVPNVQTLTFGHLESCWIYCPAWQTSRVVGRAETWNTYKIPVVKLSLTRIFVFKYKQNCKTVYSLWNRLWTCRKTCNYEWFIYDISWSLYFIRLIKYWKTRWVEHVVRLADTHTHTRRLVRETQRRIPRGTSRNIKR